MIRDKSLSSRSADVIIVTFLTLFSAITIIPYIHVVAGTFARSEELAMPGLLLFPRKPTLASIKYIFATSTFLRAMMNSVFITLAGTILSMFFTVITAFPLAQKRLVFRKQIMVLIVFTMVFNPGLVPIYLNLRMLGLLNKYAAIILPLMISTWNLIVIKNFFMNISESLLDAAKIDGCNDMGILFRVVLPVSTPVLATFTLFYSVNYWNVYLPALLFINDSDKWPMQVLLRNIVMLSMMEEVGDQAITFVAEISTKSLKMATIFVATTPILCVYPFLQRHFTKGIMLGSVKG
jgi:putative aldouronate transport system permease protein